jgi:hypothetical protein
VLAITADFHYVGLLGFLAVFAAVLAILFGRTIASGMCAFCFLVLRHKTTLLSDKLIGIILEPKKPVVKQ